MTVPAGLARRLVDIHGQRARGWLSTLPDLVAVCERRWSITVAEPFESLTYNWVAPARGAQGQALVLKLALANPEFTSEVAALQLFGPGPSGCSKG